MDIDNISGLEVAKPEGASPLYRFLIGDNRPLSPQEKIAVKEWLSDSMEIKFVPQIVPVGMGIIRLANTQEEYDEIVKDTINVHIYALVISAISLPVIWYLFN